MNKEMVTKQTFFRVLMAAAFMLVLLGLGKMNVGAAESSDAKISAVFKEGEWTTVENGAYYQIDIPRIGNLVIEMRGNEHEKGQGIYLYDSVDEFLKSGFYHTYSDSKQEGSLYKRGVAAGTCIIKAILASYESKYNDDTDEREYKYDAIQIRYQILDETIKFGEWMDLEADCYYQVSIPSNSILLCERESFEELNALFIKNLSSLEKVRSVDMWYGQHGPYIMNDLEGSYWLVVAPSVRMRFTLIDNTISNGIEKSLLSGGEYYFTLTNDTYVDFSYTGYTGTSADGINPNVYYIDGKYSVYPFNQAESGKTTDSSRSVEDILLRKGTYSIYAPANINFKFKTKKTVFNNKNVNAARATSIKAKKWVYQATSNKYSQNCWYKITLKKKQPITIITSKSSDTYELGYYLYNSDFETLDMVSKNDFTRYTYKKQNKGVYYLCIYGARRFCSYKLMWK